MNEEAAFHRALHENEMDATPTLVYSDWVEEHGKPTIAEAMRRHVEEHHQGAMDQNTDLVPRHSPVRWIKPGGYRAVAMPGAPGNYIIVLQNASLAEPGKRHFLYSVRDLDETTLDRLLKGLKGEGVQIDDGSFRSRSRYKRLAQAAAYTRKRSGK